MKHGHSIRIENWRTGTLRAGITAEALGGPHQSILPNPLIAGTFHRTGAVEVWGCDTNRVLEECERWGIEPPRFEEVTGALRVTFPAVIGPTAQVAAMLRVAAQSPVARELLQEAAGIKHREHFRKAYFEPALKAGLLERTIPDKPRSSKQRCRTTEAGRRGLERGGPHE